MRRRSATRLAALLVPVAVAGVLVGTAGADDVLPDELTDYPRPAVTGQQLADGVRAFSEGNPLRITGTPMQLQAHEQLAAEARSLGLEVQTQTYNGVLTALVATKRGATRPDETIVFGAHLDSMVGTVHGAYDNATGVRTVMELARAFADVPTHRTLEFHFYNGEEEGALGSEQVAKAYKAAKRQVSAYLGFDMVGIAWPVAGPTTDKNCLCMWRGQRDVGFEDLLREVNFEFLDFPEGKQLVSFEGVNNRNSDERMWANAGFPTMRWAGLRKAADYPEYHLPGDDMATILRVAGGEQEFGAGLRNTVLSAYYTAAVLDLEGVEAPAPVEVAPEDQVGERTVVHSPNDGHTH